MKILVVEDDNALSRVLTRSISRFGHEPLAATNGREGLEMYRGERPDMIISDIDMPEMNGLDMLRAIRKEDSEVVVIITTGYGCEKYAIEALQAKANNYLKKPVELQDLYVIIKKYAEALEASRNSSKVSFRIARQVTELEFGNCIKLVPCIVDRLVGEASGALSEDEVLSVRLGLFEMIVNAIEHGNLGITMDEKSTALNQELEALDRLYEQRLSSEENQRKLVRVRLDVTPTYCEWTIMDEGDGFDHKEVMNQAEEDPSEAVLSLDGGRGIMLSRLQFDEFEYLGNGNTLRLRKNRRQSPGPRLSLAVKPEEAMDPSVLETQELSNPPAGSDEY